MIETLYSLILLEVILDLVQLELSKEIIIICIFPSFSCYPELVSLEHLPEVLVLVAGAGGGEVRDAGHGVVILVALAASRLESCIMRGHVIIIIIYTAYVLPGSHPLAFHVVIQLGPQSPLRLLWRIMQSSEGVYE